MKKQDINTKNIRYFNQIEIVDNETNIKKSYVGENDYYKNKFFDEIIWMLKAQSLVKNNVPKIVDYSLDYENLWMKYNIIKESPLHDIYVSEKSTNESFWKQVSKSYLDFMNLLSKVQPHCFVQEEWADKIIKFYFLRTIETLEKLSENKKFKLFFKKPFIKINKKTYPSLDKILNFLKNQVILIKKKKIKENDIFYLLAVPSRERICFSHLDLIFGNVFLNTKTNSIKVIDPRGSFANSNDYGDIYYDYAKVYQCIYGLYDFIVEDKFEVNLLSEKNCEVLFSIEAPKNHKIIKEAFTVFFEGINEKVIKLLESIQFFAMTPAHEDNFKRQVVQICIGIKHFTEVVGADEIWTYCNKKE